MRRAGLAQLPERGAAHLSPASALASVASDHWKEHARQWSLVGPPLRPVEADLGFSRAAIDEWRDAARGAAPTLLVLGVTPELVRLQDDPRGRAIGVDNSFAMIRAIWPGRRHPRNAVLCGDWLRMPLATASIDLALADGSFSALPFPIGYDALCRELGRLLRPGGRVVVRLFVSPDARESVEGVLDHLERGRIGSFHVLKWRLAMALQPDAETGVAMGWVWSALDDAFGDRERLAARHSWPIEEVRTIEVYRGVETRYSFPTLAEYRLAFTAAGFSIARVSTPPYELGECCPTLVLEPADAARG